MSLDEGGELVVVEKKTNWRRWVMFPPFALIIGWLAAGSRFGQAIAGVGFVMVLDLVWMAIRSRRSNPAVTVPAIGRVGVAAEIAVCLQNTRVITWLNSPIEVTVTPMIASTDSMDSRGLPDAAYNGTNASNITEFGAITPNRRGRTGFWSVECVDYGLLGLVYRKRTFMLAGRPFSVGPQRVAKPTWNPVQLKTSPDRLDGINTQIAAGQPVLRDWRQGDKTSAIDWRRTERVGQMVVGVSEAERPQIAVLAYLGENPHDHSVVEAAAAHWASLAEQWLPKADVTLIWREQGRTHVRAMQSARDIDLALAGAEVGALNQEALDYAGVPLHARSAA